MVNLVNSQDEECSYNERVLLCQQRGLLASALHRERDSAMFWPLYGSLDKGGCVMLRPWCRLASESEVYAFARQLHELPVAEKRRCARPNGHLVCIVCSMQMPTAPGCVHVHAAEESP